MSASGKRIAVIGAGVAGLTSAYILNRDHQVTIFEKNDYLGGHTNTIIVHDKKGQPVPVDTGFIIMNERNYPNFSRLLQQLDVPTRATDMSFGYYCRNTGLQYSGKDLDTFFAQKTNLLKPKFYGMIGDIVRFYRVAIRDLQHGNIVDKTLGEYLQYRKFGKMFIEHHIIPMGAAIWSTPDEKMFDFPALSFLEFFKNHGLLTLRNRPQWKTIIGGSRVYVGKMMKSFKGEIFLNTKIKGVLRQADEVNIIMPDGSLRKFDAVVIACHADEAYQLLKDATLQERNALQPWQYSRNHTVLHTDETVMPPNRKIWSSWNYIRNISESETKQGRLTLTYHMNNLQGLSLEENYFVTLNAFPEIGKGYIEKEITYHHPNYTFNSLASQKHLPDLNGQNNTYFCGSYFGYGFHEDAVRSAVEIGKHFNLELWNQ
ncbi:FAD-dependent oxidoreductase [bacterium]|nr:FAD-dependent oxidoreductase [candidate division CSSED10-310 bacterium]